MIGLSNMGGAGAHWEIDIIHVSVTLKDYHNYSSYFFKVLCIYNMYTTHDT